MPAWCCADTPFNQTHKQNTGGLDINKPDRQHVCAQADGRETKEWRLPAALGFGRRDDWAADGLKLTVNSARGAARPPNSLFENFVWIFLNLWLMLEVRAARYHRICINLMMICRRQNVHTARVCMRLDRTRSLDHVSIRELTHGGLNLISPVHLLAGFRQRRWVNHVTLHSLLFFNRTWRDSGCFGLNEPS